MCEIFVFFQNLLIYGIYIRNLCAYIQTYIATQFYTTSFNALIIVLAMSKWYQLNLMYGFVFVVLVL